MKERQDLEAVSEAFIRFAVHFFKLTREHFQQQNCVKANTLAFHALLILRQLDEESPTMSELAALLGITKQQLTKLVNDLEEKGLVQREHGRQNRRQVYLSLTPEGALALAALRREMLDCTMNGLAAYTPQELSELSDCLARLGRLLPKFRPAGPEDSGAAKK